MATHWEQLQHMRKLSGKRVLDVGAGRGKFLVEAALGGAVVTGLEPNKDYREQAMERVAEKGVSASVCAGSVESLPFADSSFDFVNAAEVYEHVEDPATMLTEMYRVLEWGGSVYISIPNRFGMKDQHFHLWFVNWLPRVWSDAFITFFGAHKQYDGASGRQRLKEMHYVTYGTAVEAVRNAGFTATDIREHKVRNRFPVLLPLYWLLRPWFFDSFHLYLAKKPTRVLAVYRGRISEDRGTPLRVRGILERIARDERFALTVATWDKSLPFATSHLYLTNNKISDFKTLVQTIHRERIDVVMGHTMGTWYYLAFLKLFTGVRIVLEMHGFIEEEALFYKSIGPVRFVISKMVYACFYPLCSAITTSSDTATRILSKYNRHVQTMWCAVESDVFSPAVAPLATIPRPPGSLILGYAGNNRKWQGLEFLVDAFTILRAEDPSLLLYILSSETKDLPEGPGIHTFPSLPHNDVPGFLRACDILIIPRLQNRVTRISFASKLPEYLAVGRPVVSSATSDAQYIIEHGSTGFLYEPGNTKEFMQIIRDLKDASLRDRIGERAAEMARTRLSWPRQIAILTDILDNRSSPYVKGRLEEK